MQFHLCFSQSWSIRLNDSDFYCCDSNTPIVIEGTVLDVPAELIDKYGNHVRGVRGDGTLIDDMEAQDAANVQTTLTVLFKVGMDLVCIIHSCRSLADFCCWLGRIFYMSHTDYASVLA